MIVRGRARHALISVIVASACASGAPSITLEPSTTTTTAPESATSDSTAPANPNLIVDVADAGDSISPLILGIADDGGPPDYFDDAGIVLRSWGGETATRYNYVIGNASNGGARLDYQNQPVGAESDAVADFVASASAAGAVSRVAVPTLGWVASDTEPVTCSFPLLDGTCGNADGASCLQPGTIANPRTTSVPSAAAGVASWIERLGEDPSTTPRFIAFDNEPELWGISHYDVHPACSTYEEVLLKYLEYANAVRDVAPDAELMGPVMCCWFDYWRAAPGPADGSGEEFLGWFLRHVREHDETNDRRTLDVVDVRYFPQTDVLNDDIDPKTSARRLRSTRSLYDPDYTDESWLAVQIRFLPRLRHIIETSYPGTPIGISGWNWGADNTLNGALAIADVLGVYGREGVYVASYSEGLPPGSPGYFAFKMHGNYDGLGSRFGGQVVPVVAQGVDADDDVGAYAAFDPDARMLRLMLINKHVDSEIELTLDIRSLDTAPAARVFRYDADDLGTIAEAELSLGDLPGELPSIALPPYSITVIEVPAT